ncbi:MAG: hypothetical protein PHQ66_03215 [Candidatus Nanoarchaeia archaeon]|nr:hypothetical protein [Candidatus Nanoarchaeia archaeon]MDD5357626.1 hypothetical protein [Candidatus Nanoarchaeia archaeon]MDD5588545.1 hypothetical protein [Candidatus Nanoarchaeia archaeon]
MKIKIKPGYWIGILSMIGAMIGIILGIIFHDVFNSTAIWIWIGIIVGFTMGFIVSSILSKNPAYWVGILALAGSLGGFGLSLVFRNIDGTTASSTGTMIGITVGTVIFIALSSKKKK